ncbi:GspE/PulE family protein [Aeromonas veronii]|uniref:Secretion system protein E n=1 Tax=Aeromonas veronii TaxID=654 RepID=A0A2T4MX61_AERVE|nr:GspE/PulE family protein [Aeromonas veronii]PTH79183.1 secretion system protein E [Aeromonas veronii]
MTDYVHTSKSRDDLLEEYLIKKNHVKLDAIRAARMEQEITGDSLGTILVRNGFLRHDVYIEAILLVTDKSLADEGIILPHVPSELLRELKVKIAAQTIEAVYVSTLRDQDEVKYRLEPFFKGRKIIFTDASAESIDSYLEQVETINDSESSVLEKMIRKAITSGVSDIHIQPRQSSYTVFFRHLGVRHIFKEGDLDEYLQLAARIKDRSRMDLAERRIPQDGGFSIEHDGRLVDLRVAAVPTLGGEVIVIRILDPVNANRKLDDLGITKLENWRKGSSRLNGLCLICGATGSGKTTTLNGTIRELDRFGKAIYTAEDPVEYNIPYISQVNINESVGLDFSRALRAFMRADPDIIVLGEIRDANTARNAIKAAETGHLVMATMHTNSILGAVNRFRDLGVPEHELRDVLRTVLSQSLIRTICKECHGEDADCPHCMGTGYSGRTIISECHYFSNSEEVSDTFSSRKIIWETIIEDAYNKLKQGITDMKELYRVFGAEINDLINKKEKEEKLKEGQK